MSYIGATPTDIPLTSSDLADGLVTAAKLATDSVTTVKVVASNVTTAKIADDNVTTAKVLDNNVTLAKIADGTQGDILYYGASGAPTLLGYGTSGDFLKTQGTGANPAWATAGGGKIGQAVTSQLTTSLTRTTYTTRADISGLSRTITPGAASSKILIHLSLYGQCTSGYSGMWFLMRDVDSGGFTDIGGGTSTGSRSSAVFNIRWSSANNAMALGKHLTWLDTPTYSLTDVLTYKVQWDLVDGASGTIYLNRSIDDDDSANRVRTASQITCMEVLA